MDININVNFPALDIKLGQIADALNFIIKQNQSIMTKQEQFDAALVKLNTVTNDIAEDLQELKQQIADGSVSAESLAQLDANVSTLEAIGAQDNPVPEPTPPAPVEPGTPETPVEPTP